MIKEALAKYDLILKLEDMCSVGENSNKDKYTLKEMKNLLKTLKKPVEENKSIEENIVSEAEDSKAN
jgi:hypothetical protein